MTNRSLAATARKKLLRQGRALLRRGQRASTGRAALDLEGLSEVERKQLAEIHAALERIERGTYGRCDRCFGSVESDLLERVPWERYCSGCRDQTDAGVEANA